jgi:hypothetical protein
MKKTLISACAAAFVLAGLICAVGGGSDAAPAGAAWQGEFSSSLLNPMPSHPIFDMEIYDDTDENLAFRETFLDALARAGYQVNDNAPYFFTFATSITWQAKRQQEVQKERIRKYPVERDETTIPPPGDPHLQGNPETRMFGDRRTTPPLIAPKISNREHDRLDISVAIRERKSNKVTWTADLALPLLRPERERIVRSIIGPIISNIGRDVSHEPFEVK